MLSIRKMTSCYLTAEINELDKKIPQKKVSTFEY